jgi:hypothetical protein
MTSSKYRTDIIRQSKLRNCSHLQMDDQQEEEEDRRRMPWGRRGLVQVEAQVGQPRELRWHCRQTSHCFLLTGDVWVLKTMEDDGKSIPLWLAPALLRPGAQQTAPNPAGHVGNGATRTT